ncbi:MAG: DUF2644 domain-containing protein [Gammaproteobacteria bacterium]|nr:DUF2644 domain-containing protein [Gammaproteobacteria bacterium]
MKIHELYTNADGRLSTTTFMQFFGGVLMASVLLFSVYRGSPDVPELFTTFALYCGGMVATKGAVTAYKETK